MTLNGDPCKFPFTFEGKTYSACTTVKNTVPWCQTKKSWGECVKGCPGTAAPSTTPTHIATANPTANPSPTPSSTGTDDVFSFIYIMCLLDNISI